MGDASPFMGAEELRNHQQDWMRQNVGTDDIAEGVRRLQQVQNWRCENHGE